MNISVLNEYVRLQDELTDIVRRKNKHEEELKKLENNIVEDSVKGSTTEAPYIETRVHIEGVADRGAVFRKRLAINKLRQQMENKEADILEKQSEVEEFLDSVDDCQIRQIIRYRFFDELTWGQVEAKMAPLTAGACKMMLHRFIKDNSVTDVTI